jgi:hypothetical protein
MNSSDHAATVEFEALIDAEGKLVVPANVVAMLGNIGDGRVHVRITSGALDRRLRSKGITEDELDRIAAMQLESRDQVMKFMLTEGGWRRGTQVRRNVRRRSRSR